MTSVESVAADSERRVSSKLDSILTESAQKAFDNWVNKRYRK